MELKSGVSVSDNTQKDLKEQIDIHTRLLSKLKKKLITKQKA
jgi:hypothetical protein